MKFTSDDSATRRLTSKKNRCVWMEAGILSYLLCDREFECERCPLDEAMRSHFSPDGEHPSEAMKPEAPPGTRPSKSRTFYTPAHLQVTVLDDGSCRLSLEPGIVKLIPPMKSIVLPRSGDHVAAEAFCSWLIFEGGTLPVKLPLGGVVGGVNSQLSERPHLLNGPDDSWLFDFIPDDQDAIRKALSEDAGVESKYVSDMDTFRRLTMECLHPGGARVGHTLQDGGRPVDDLSTMIGPVKYLEIVRRAIWTNH